MVVVETVTALFAGKDDNHFFNVMVRLPSMVNK